jgi:formylglycine-generating enzyme required for sulfatase activity
VGSPPSPLVAHFPNLITSETVDLPRFFIDRTEVTNAAFGVFSGMTAITGVWHPTYPDAPQLLGAANPDFPVAALTWIEARAYCRFLGKELPTSQQWEKALRGGVELHGAANPAPDRNFPWGTAEARRVNLASEVHHAARVGTFPDDESPYGVLDMAGNVQEWTDSRPADAAEHHDQFRITRGGNWDETAPGELVDYMAIENPRAVGYRGFTVGVRCARSGD